MFDDDYPLILVQYGGQSYALKYNNVLITGNSPNVYIFMSGNTTYHIITNVKKGDSMAMAEGSGAYIKYEYD